MKKKKKKKRDKDGWLVFNVARVVSRKVGY
jgi:hypothetical protein